MIDILIIEICEGSFIVMIYVVLMHFSQCQENIADSIWYGTKIDSFCQHTVTVLQGNIKKVNEQHFYSTESGIVFLNLNSHHNTNKDC